MKLLTIIPAKLDSKRLPNKNLQEINNKSLIEHSIGYAKQSKYDNVIVVSTEDTELVKKSWKAVQNNLGKFQGLFGSSNMLVVDNSEYKDFPKIIKNGAREFIKRPIQNHVAKKWIKKELELRKK